MIRKLKVEVTQIVEVELDDSDKNPESWMDFPFNVTHWIIIPRG